ncbi:MAG: isoleucine--tRNA ligase [Gemmatimonadetes bacterium]|nr:MAG: isoleucine--tRNA ligase [Gemmatimonadota bacterium]
MAYPLLDPKLTADALEKQLLAAWKHERLFEKTQDAARYGPPFVFYEGPPTANGRPGIHHVFARTIKDLVCRYHTMLGQGVTRIAGWDTHGLPVEIEVERMLGISGKKQIEAYGVEKFNRLCRENVFKYKTDWESLSERIAYWLDYDHPYITYSNDYIETVWWLLKRLHEKALLYRGHKVLPYCPRCGTALSSHELALGYEEVQTNSVYVTFPLAPDANRQLVIWTTTPWTLLANVAVAVHPDLEYGEYEVNGVRYIVAAERAAHVHVGGKFVSAEEGTGLVHMAPAFGADDYAAAQQYGLAFANPVAPDGTFQDTRWPEINGRLVTDKETNRLIIERLKHEGRWLETLPYTHSYPFCWRCDSALIYYARSSWFVRTTAVRARMLEVNAQVAWHPPEVGSGRFGAWLENNVDWALSRDRYWGTPLNVWECDAEAEHREVIGSYAELAERWGKRLAKDFDPHKPAIDQYSWRCRACGGTMRRVPEVIDAWFDSGAMPYAQWHYPSGHQADFKAHFPADFICEGVDQTRGWFYSLLAIGVTAFDALVYKNVIVNELVLDAQGQKMSKSRGNVVNPWEVIEEVGADAVRLYLLGQSQVWLPKRFDRRQIPDVTGGFLNALRSTYTFFQRYAQAWTPPDPSDADATPFERRPATDRWLLARLDEVVGEVRRAWSDYDVTAGVRAIMDFVGEDLSRWYIRRNRPRFWAPDRATDAVALETLHEALVTSARLLAPAAPFVADWIHRALMGGSVHLAPFPTDQGRRAPELLQAMGAVRKLASLARAARETKQLAVRQPVARVKVVVPAAVRGPALADLLDILAAEVNAKDIEVVGSDHELVRLKGKAEFRSLGKRYGKDTPRAAAAVSQLTAEELEALERGEPVRAGEFEFRPEDVLVTREVMSDWAVQADGPYVAAVDPRLSEDLIQEGLARELVNRVQRLRKEAGYEYTTRIELSVAGAEEIVAAVSAFQSFVEGETLTRKIVLGTVLEEADLTREVDIEARRVTIALRRHDGRKGGTR